MKTLIVFLVLTCAASAQNIEPLNPNITTFAYPSEPFEGDTRALDKKVVRKLLLKPHKFVNIPYPIIRGGRKPDTTDSSDPNHFGDSIDVNSFYFVNDTLYYHGYAFQTDGYSKRKLYFYYPDCIPVSQINDNSFSMRNKLYDHRVYRYYLDSIAPFRKTQPFSK